MPAAPLAELRSDPGHGRWSAVRAFPLTRILVAMIPIAAVIAVVQLALAGLGIAPYGPLGAALALASGVAVALVYAAFVRRVERRAVDELAAAPRELGVGLGVGLGLFVVTVGVIAAAGGVRVERGDGLAAVLPALCFAAAAAISEEIVFRGIVLRLLEDRLGSWIALAISASIFGVLHLPTPGGSLIGALAITVEAGVLLGAAYLSSRRLWLPIGLHTGWNFAQIGVFGVAATDRPVPGIWSTRFDGPAVLTGGDAGPEASIVAVIACLAVAVALLLGAHRRARIVPPRRARATRGWIAL